MREFYYAPERGQFLLTLQFSCHGKDWMACNWVDKDEFTEAREAEHWQVCYDSKARRLEGKE